MTSSLLESYCSRWKLGEPHLLASTHTSDVYRVRCGEYSAVLKILNEKGRRFEGRGAVVLRCFDGNGAVRLLEADRGAHLLEYVDGPALRTLIEHGDDTRACEIMCEVIESLHSYEGPVPAELISMERNFQSLFLRVAYDTSERIYAEGELVARELLASEQDQRVLHGDLHHENVLESSRRGWLAIDPQCLYGERTYDFANLFYNPNGFTDFSAAPATIEERLKIYSTIFGIDPARMLKYAFAYGCLSAAWSSEDGESPDETLVIARAIRGVLKSRFGQ